MATDPIEEYTSYVQHKTALKAYVENLKERQSSLELLDQERLELLDDALRVIDRVELILSAPYVNMSASARDELHSLSNMMNQTSTLVMMDTTSDLTYQRWKEITHLMQLLMIIDYLQPKCKSVLAYKR